MRAFAKPTGENRLSQHPQRVRQSELGISPTMKEFQNGKERETSALSLRVPCMSLGVYRQLNSEALLAVPWPGKWSA